MNDCELLELAAKAAGRHYDSVVGSALISGRGFVWNPLNDDGDALRLAVKLKLMVRQSWNGADCAIASRLDESAEVMVRYAGNPYSATRRAIVRAAAEIGKGMK